MSSKAVADDHLIIEAKKYYNHLGMYIEHRVIVYGKPPNGFTEFVGHGGIPVQDEAGNADSIPFEFGIPAKDINGAFLQFRICCDAKGAALKEELRQAQLDAQAPRILTPG